jgi:hypothetical protein
MRWWRLRLVTLLAALALAPAQADDAAGYLRGYLDALLDSRYPSLGLHVQQLSTPDGTQVTLGARDCLSAARRHEVERLLAATRAVQTVQWSAVARCERAPAATDTPLALRWLPEEELFAPLLADPRQPRFSMSYQRYRTTADHFNAASVAFGEYFPFATGILGRSGSSQIGIQGAVFALFNLDAPSSDLVNADYFIGFPLSYRKGPWSATLKFYHQSSHLGDEFLLGSPGIDRVNLSYEDLLFLASYEWNHWRVYGGGGYLLRAEPSLDPWHAQLGVEYLRARFWGELDFVAAADRKSADELNWALSRSYQVGLEFGSRTPRRLRLMLEYYDGHSPNGQFYREKLQYTGLGLYFRF